MNEHGVMISDELLCVFTVMYHDLRRMTLGQVQHGDIGKQCKAGGQEKQKIIREMEIMRSDL